MNGNKKCALLREVRKRICELNGLEYNETDCHHADECVKGACPACEAQLERINVQLQAKRLRGETVIYESLSETFERELK